MCLRSRFSALSIGMPHGCVCTDRTSWQCTPYTMRSGQPCEMRNANHAERLTYLYAASRADRFQTLSGNVSKPARSHFEQTVK
eukprot:1196112-Prorocentrum_minimum.AAC.5